MALIATTPPLRRLANAAMTTSPLGAKVTRNPVRLGRTYRSRTRPVSTSDSAERAMGLPRVETYTSQFHASDAAIGKMRRYCEAKQSHALARFNTGPRKLRNR